MSSTSPNFNLVLASTSDVVSVTSHVANNFSTLDTILAAAHTGTGQIRAGVVITTPTLINPVISGTISGGDIIIASTGKFSTITATGGALTINSFSIGTYGVPATVGAAGTILTVVTGNAQWVAAAPGTGAAGDLSNLAAVAINTSLNTFTAGFVTVNRIITTSGALTGLTAFQATAGTFAGNVTISGTATVNIINVTGGAITAGSLAIGTYALPATVGATGQVMRVTTANAVWYTPTMTAITAFNSFVGSGDLALEATGTNLPIVFTSERYDLGGNVTTGAFTAPTSGIYDFAFKMVMNPGNLTAGFDVGILIATTAYPLSVFIGTAAAIGATADILAVGAMINTVASGAVVSLYAVRSSGSTAVTLRASGNTTSYFIGKRLFEF